MNQIWILIRVLATGVEPNLPVLFVDPVNATHHILAFCDLVLDFAFRRIDQIKMPPAVALGDVDRFIGLLQPVDETQAQTLRVLGPDERLGFLVDEVADCAGLRIHFDHPKSLAAPVHVLVGKMASVAIPVETGCFPFVLESIHLRFGQLVVGDIKEIQLIQREFVAGQRVGTRLELGAAATGR